MGFDVVNYIKQRDQKYLTVEKSQNARSGAAWKQSVDNRRASSAVQSINDRLSTWQKNNQNFIRNYTDRFSGTNSGYRGDSADQLSVVTAQKANFDKEADSILKLIDEYSNYLDGDYVSRVKDALGQSRTAQSEILSDYTKDNDYWSQFGSEESYNAYVQQQEAYKNAARLDILDAEDYAEYSKAGESKTKFIGGDNRYDYINDINHARLLHASPPGLLSKDPYLVYDYMTEDEIGIYNYVYAKEGKEDADAYLDAIEGTLEDRLDREVAEGATQLADKHPVLSSGLSVLTSLGSGGEYLGDLLKAPFTGEIDSNTYANATNAIRGTVSEKASFEIAGWDAGAFLYNTGMSMLDSASAMLTGGPYGGVQLGLSAAAQGTNDALQRGMSNGQAFASGLFSGVFEGLFETFSIGNFNKLKEIAPATIGDIARNIGKSMLVNASEETLTEIANITYDTLANGEYANYTLEELKSGDTWKEIAQQIGEAAGSGALMGVGFGGGGNAMGYRKNTVAGNRLSEQGYTAEDAVAAALELDPNNQTALRIKAKLDEGKTVSAAELSTLFGQNRSAIAQNGIREDVGKRLTELGESGNVGALSDILAKKETGEKLKLGEKRTLKNSQFGQQVSDERKKERKDALMSFFRESGKVGFGFQNAVHAVEAQGISDFSKEEAFRAYSLAENEAKAKKKGATATTDTAENAESRTVVELDDSEVKERTAASAVVKETNGEETVEREVNVQAVERVEGGKVTVKLEDGSTVDAETVDFEDGEVGTLYRASSGLSADAANRMIASYERTSNVDAVDYANQFTTAYNYGRAGISTKELAADANLSGLTDAQKQVAYKLGREETLAERRASSERAKNARATGEKESGQARGRVRLEKGVALKTDIQRTSHKALQRLAAAIGVDFYLYESRVVNGRRVYIDEEGDETRANGWYDPSDGSIHLDVNAGAGGEGTILFTAAHELTHFIRDWSPEKFGVLADFLMEQYNKAGVPVRELIENQRQKAKKNGRELSFDEAYEEVIADSMETMLTDGKVISELASRDRTLFEKIKDFIADLAKKVKALYKSMLPNSNEGRIVADMVGALDRVQAMFTDALGEASENYARGQKNNAREGARYSFAGRDAKTADQSMLERAMQMDEAGRDSETIRQETGWFKGYDGKWRFEIDDSEMEIAFNGKFSRNPDIRRYSELVEKVYFEGDATAEEETELRALDKKLENVPIEPKKLGDLIRHPKLFAAYPQLQDVNIYFSDKAKAGNASYHPGFNEIAMSMHDKLNPQKAKTLLVHEIQHAIQEIEGLAGGSNPDMFVSGERKSAYQQYRDTAGEVEARDVSKRREYTAEHRKNTRPDIDRSDVVFADGGVSYFSKTEYDAEKAGIHDQIRNSQDKLNQMEAVFVGNVPNNVGNKQQGGTWAIAELKKYGYQADRQNFGTIYFDEKSIRYAMNYLDTNEEKASIAALYKVLKQGVQIGEHGNHKDRSKHTVTFAAPVILNGVRGNMAVVVNARGNKYYVHRILMPDGSIFKFDSKQKDAGQESQRGVPERSLANATSSASDNSISQPDDSVNRKFSDRDYTDLETHFGTTRNYDVAGYLMTDGKMLDFSGSHWGDTSSDFRQVDHRDVYEVESIEGEFENGRAAMVGMIGDGNIRLSPESGGINLAVLPNAKQMTALRGYINHFGGEVVVDVDDIGGDTIHSFEYNKGTSADRIIADIKGYFENGTIPEAQSELGQFRYSDRDEEADFSSRGILTRAKEEDARTPAEKQRLEQYQTMRAEYDELEAKRYEISDRLRLIRASDGKRDKAYWAEFNRLRNESIATGNRLTNLERRLRSYEGSKTLSTLIERERRRQMEEYDRINREEARRGRDKFVERNAKADLKRKILSGFNFLNRRLENPTKTEHVPEALRKPVASWLKIFNMDYAEADERVENYNNLIAGTNAQIAGYRSDIETLEPQERALQSQLADARVEATKAQQALTEAEAEYRNRRTDVLELDERRRALYRELDAESDEAKKESIRTELRRTGKQLMDLKAKRSVASAARDKAKDALRAANRKVEKISGQLDKLEEARAELPVLEGKLDSFVKTRDRLEEQGVRLNGVLSELQTAYEQILLEPDDDVAAEYNKDISDKIIGVKQSVGDTALRSMSVTQLEEVYELLCMIRGEVSNKNKVFTEAQNQVISENGQKLMQQADSQGRVHKRMGIKGVDKGLDLVDTYTYGNDKPDTFFERLDCDVLRERQQALVKGQDTYAKDVKEGKTFFEKQADEHGYLKWDLDREVECTARNGKQFHIAIAEIMSLYAYSRDVESLDHIEKGGFTFMRTIKKVVEKNGKKKTIHVQRKETYNLSREQVAEICAKHLNDEQRAFVEKMQDYLSTVMGAKGNEVSLKRYGIKLFKKKFYFPIRTDASYQAELNDTDGERKVINKGFTNSRKPHASNPIVLEGFMDVWARHVDEMSMYHGMALPLEDFSRIMNYTERGTVGGASGTGVRESVANAYGEAAVQYIDQYLKDLNSGIKADPKERIVSGLVSRFKKISVVASLSVIIQQPTSIVRAFAEINPTYFVFGEKLDRMSHAQAWEELQKYAGVATIKEIGGFDTGTTGSAVDYILDREDSLKRKVGDFIAKNAKLEKVGNAIGHAQSLAARADESTWIAIWKACQREQAALHPELKGEALKKAAGERFTEVVNLTQVYDSTLAKSQHMRSKNMMMTMLTAFMAEPTTSINMLERGARLFMRGERKKAVRMMTSVWTASIFTAVASSIVYAMRDDDEDETFWEKYFSSIAVETIDNLNPLTSLPIIKDAWSIVQGYDVERIDMSLFSDFYNAFTKAKRIREKDIEGMTEADLEKHYKDMRNADLDVVAMGASLLRIPAKNVIRDLRAVENVISTVWKDLTVEGRDTSPRSVIDRVQTDLGSSWNIGPSSGFQLIAEEGKNEQLYEAIVAGDGKYVARLKSSYEDETAYDSAVRKALKEKDPRIKQAAEARVKGDFATRDKLLEEIAGEGHFSKDMVAQAINNAQNDITRDAAELLRTTDERIGQAAALKESDSEYQRIVSAIVREGKYSRETVVKAINTQKGKIEDEEKNEATSWYNASDVNAAYEEGDEDLAHEIIDDLIATKVANGTEEERARSSVRSSMTRYWKPIYKAAYDSGDTEECERIEDILADSELYGRPKELRNTLKGWRKDEEEE